MSQIEKVTLLGELLQAYPYLTVLRGELHGIVDEIEPYMAQKFFIACVFYLVKVNVELDLFLFPLALERGMDWRTCSSSRNVLALRLIVWLLTLESSRMFPTRSDRRRVLKMILSM